MPSPRSAEVYADFLLPHLSPRDHLVDVGCGSGELSLDLAGRVGRLTGIDDDRSALGSARLAARTGGIGNATFQPGDAYALDLAGGTVDVVLAHSVLEELDRPEDALREMVRVLRPEGVLGVACVEYAGLILGGPQPRLTRAFYDLREQLWLADGADPYRGRRLRGLLVGAGLTAVEATSTYICYGTPEEVREFGRGRAEDCADDWYLDTAQRHGLATPDDLDAMRSAWLEWAEAPTSYAAFAWCRAIGRKSA